MPLRLAVAAMLGLLLVLLGSPGGAAAAAASFANLCNGMCASGMVLPAAPQRARLWGGLGQAGLEVTVVLTDASSGGEFVARGRSTGEGGAWSVTFDAGALQPTREATVLLQARWPGQTAVQVERVLERVWVGQVWLCAGQVRDNEKSGGAAMLTSRCCRARPETRSCVHARER
jgi:hypothetical protein